jgi:hypothetical protein
MYDYNWSWHITHLHQFSPRCLVLLILGILVILSFELWMLIDVLACRKVPTNQRVWWVVGMFLLHPFVALVYLFARHNYKQA